MASSNITPGVVYWEGFWLLESCNIRESLAIMIVPYHVIFRRLLLSCLLLALWLAGASSAWSQYPASPQITKDGTTVQLEDYASLPISSRTITTYPPAINL